MASRFVVFGQSSMGLETVNGAVRAKTAVQKQLRRRTCGSTYVARDIAAVEDFKNGEVTPEVWREITRK
jgi:hypothetical protein